MAKRGRPKKPSRPLIDEGTKELREKRMFISPQDQTLTTNPLDALLARRMISDEAYSAAGYFAALRKLVFGKAIPPAIDLNATSGGEPDEFDGGKAEGRYRDACAAMNRVSRGSRDAVENLVVHERWPSWMFAVHRGGHTVDRRKFGEGMAALLGWYQGRRRERRAAE